MKPASPTDNLRAARRWCDYAINESAAFRIAWQRTRHHALSAGCFFIRARALCTDGQWLGLLQENAARIKPRTVQFWMQLSSEALQWAAEARPGLKGAKLEKFAIREVMLMSPKPLVALLRDLRELRPFGEYDAVKYAQRKLGAGAANGQFEFAFTDLIAPLDPFLHLDEPNARIIFPEGADQKQCVADIKAKLHAALAKVEAFEKGITDV